MISKKIFRINSIDYHVVRKPHTNGPMIARVDGFQIDNRKEIFRIFLRSHGWTDEMFGNRITNDLERQINKILNGNDIAPVVLETNNQKCGKSNYFFRQKDYLMHVDDCMGIGIDSSLSLAAYISFISAALGRPLSAQLMVLDSMTIGGTVNKVENLPDSLQVCFDAGAKKILLPMSSATEIATVPADLFAKFQISFYSSPEDAAIKALGIE